jgi:hypothetical protein
MSRGPRSNAAQRKQRVGGEQKLILGQVVADVAGRMARRLDHLDRMAGKGELSAVAEGKAEAGYLVGLVLGAGDLDVEALLQCQVRLDVVVMVVGGKDIGQRPAAPCQRVEDRLLLRRVDRGGPSGLRIVQQYAEIVAAAAEEFDLQFSHRLVPSFACAALFSRDVVPLPLKSNPVSLHFDHEYRYR